jgi:hypothetical protein
VKNKKHSMQFMLRRILMDDAEWMSQMRKKWRRRKYDKIREGEKT